jgi:hypothetical protein
VDGANRFADKIGRARRVEQINAMPVPFGHERFEAQRRLALDLLGRVIAHARALRHAPVLRRGLGNEQQRVEHGSFAAAVVAEDGHRADFRDIKSCHEALLLKVVGAIPLSQGFDQTENARILAG